MANYCGVFSLVMAYGILKKYGQIHDNVYFLLNICLSEACSNYYYYILEETLFSNGLSNLYNLFDFAQSYWFC